MKKHKHRLLFFGISACWLILFLGCKKNGADTGNNIIINTPPSVAHLLYGDSIIYLKNSSSDYIVSPTQPRRGHYTAFPEGLVLDENTGDINVSKSETGLRYLVFFSDNQNIKDTTLITLSGVNYADHYYHLSEGDSIAYPLYNMLSASTPCNGSIGCTFDEGNSASTAGLAVKINSGAINLAQTVRNGIFGKKDYNNARQDIEIKYRLNDNSNKALNSITIRMYYYNTMEDVPSDLRQLITDRQTAFLRTSSYSFDLSAIGDLNSAAARPRPPCIIIVGR